MTTKERIQKLGLLAGISTDAEERRVYNALTPLQQRMCRDSGTLPSDLAASIQADLDRIKRFGAPPKRRK